MSVTSSLSAFCSRYKLIGLSSTGKGILVAEKYDFIIICKLIHYIILHLSHMSLLFFYVPHTVVRLGTSFYFEDIRSM